MIYFFPKTKFQVITNINRSRRQLNETEHSSSISIALHFSSANSTTQPGTATALSRCEFRKFAREKPQLAVVATPCEGSGATGASGLPTPRKDPWNHPRAPRPCPFSREASPVRLVEKLSYICLCGKLPGTRSTRAIVDESMVFRYVAAVED